MDRGSSWRWRRPAPTARTSGRALWQVDPAGDAAPRRLTRSAVGESNAAFLPDGSLLFTSARPDPDAKKDDKPDEENPPAALWHLPAAGGEARLLLAPAGGIAGMKVARDAGAVALLAPLHPGAADFDADRERHKARKDAGVSAMLYETYPIRYWDHYLGPREARYFVADAPADDDASAWCGRGPDRSDRRGPPRARVRHRAGWPFRSRRPGGDTGPARRATTSS